VKTLLELSQIRRALLRAWALSLGAAFAVALGSATRVLAYPPAPHHLIYGLARDEYGTPFLTSEIQVVLQTPTGVQLSAPITPGIGPGVNFLLEVPMDAGLTPDPYTPLALRRAAPFQLFVVIGTTTNLPIQMTANYALLGLPGQATRLDITLGVDANGDGIPDAWEYAFLSAIGSNLGLSDLRPGLDFAHNGRTLLQEFALGNYPFNPGASPGLKVVNLDHDTALLEFTTMTGRSYSIQGSADLAQWAALAFTIPAEGTSPPVRSFYFAPDIRTVQVRTSSVGVPGSTPGFFRLILQ
jgi:hypothetical protein